MEPPDEDLLVRIFNSYNSGLWYFRANAFREDVNLVLNCYLRADVSDPEEVVYHNIIRMKSRVGSSEADDLMESLSKSTNSSRWTWPYPRSGNVMGWGVSQLDVVKSPWTMIDLMDSYGIQHAWEPKRHYFDVDVLKTLHLRLIYAVMTMQSVSRGDAVSAFDATGGLWCWFGSPASYDLQPIRKLLSSVAPRDVMMRLSMIRRVRFSWE